MKKYTILVTTENGFELESFESNNRKEAINLFNIIVNIAKEEYRVSLWNNVAQEKMMERVF